MKKAYWISYDLGVGGDYPHLYQWLDDHEAVPCGNSVAFLFFDYKTNNPDNELLKSLSMVQFQPGNIFYAIRKKEDGDGYFGSFLYGKRQSAPWTGFGTKAKGEIDG